MSTILGRSTGQLIRYYRELANITVPELADRIGCPWELIADWENGRDTPGVTELHMLAACLNVNPMKLLSER